MKSKAHLFLIELLIMLLVFSVSAALCLKTFSKAEQISIENEMRDSAVIDAQNTAQMIKSSGGIQTLDGTFDGQKWVIDKGEYLIFVTEKESNIALLGSADITVTDKDSNEIFALEVSYQKEVAK